MNQGAIPDESPRNLQEQLLLQDAKAGNCRAIQGGPDDILGDVSRLVALYGGNPEDWYKITSIQAFVINELPYKCTGLKTGKFCNKLN